MRVRLDEKGWGRPYSTIALCRVVCLDLRGGQAGSGQVSPVVRYRDADYVTFKDGKAGRTCIGFRRVGRPQRGGYDSLTGGVLCAPSGKNLTQADVGVFIDKARLQPSVR